MGERLPFDRLVHSDWSRNRRKRWTAIARRISGKWHVDLPSRTLTHEEFRKDLLNADYRTLAGFDFAIGLPGHYLDRIKQDFISFILHLKKDADFFRIADRPEQVSTDRPFFPNVPKRGYGHDFLLEGHGGCSYHDLLRACERRTVSRNEAGSIFWTVGSKQVGKGALSGWQEVLVPSRREGAQIWPFDGCLAELASGTLTIAETYPSEAYGHVGIPLGSKASKTRQDDRRTAMSSLIERCNEHHITLCEEVRQSISSGFGPRKSDEDPFDALVGLLSMIEVAEGRRAASPASNEDVQKREGWILGQLDLPREQQLQSSFRGASASRSKRARNP